MTTIESMIGDAMRNAEETTYPNCYHSQSGDCVFFFNEPGEFFATRVDGLLTLYLAPSDNRVIGAQVKGVSKIKDLAGIGVGVQAKFHGSGMRMDAVTLLLASHKTESRPASAGVNRTEAYTRAIRSFCDLEVDVQPA